MVKFNYKPLPSHLSIKQSNIEGMGLFTDTAIETGIVIGISHVKIPYLYEIIRTPIGGFVNHSDRPNCVLVEKVNLNDDYKLFELVALTDIEPGEELTTKYSLEQDD
jgi:SET domain-containing protein